jgi:hypothetical protein
MIFETARQQQLVMHSQGVESSDLRVGMILPGDNEFVTQEDIDFILAYRAAYEASKNARPAAPIRSGPTAALPGDSDISIRASNIIGNAGFINPPRYPLNNDGTIDTPLDKVQPQFYGIAQGTWQSILTNALPWARINGLPDLTVAVPGMAFPLNTEERAALQALLDKENAT